MAKHSKASDHITGGKCDTIYAMMKLCEQVNKKPNILRVIFLESLEHQQHFIEDKNDKAEW